MRPQPPPPQPRPGEPAALDRRLRLAGAALLWERLWPALVPLLSLLAVFLALALFDVLPLLPGWLHGLVLAGFAGAVGFLGWRAATVPRPAEDEAARRLERDSGLSHRPLAALGDRLAAGEDDPIAKALWQLHKRRMAEMAARLKLSLPAPGMPARDPLGYRFAALLLLAVALAGGLSGAGDRLGRALSPDIAAPGGGASLELWVTPPAYTGLPPMVLKPGAEGPIPIPDRSTVLAILAGGWGGASLVVDGQATPFQRQEDGSQRLEAKLEAGGSLAVKQAWHTVARWPIQIVRDALPSIDFAGPIEAGERGRLAVPVEASDDYGLEKAWLTIRRADGPADEEPLTVPLPLPSGHPRSVQSTSWHDLTAHPWSGLPVSITPSAQDGLGQVGSGQAVTVTLPERSFTHPVARALIEKRRLITEDRWNGPAISRWLAALLSEPASLNNDAKVVLALGVTRRALQEPEEFDLAELQDLLWNAALRLEEGDLAGAERAFEEARRALEQALAGNAPAEQVERLVQQLQAAMERLLDAMAEQLARSGRMPQDAPSGAQAITPEELGRMFDGMRDLAETGNRDALRRMLDNLSQMMAGMRMEQPPGNPQAEEGMRKLGELTRRQQQLLDQSFRNSNPPPPGDPSGESADAPRGGRPSGEGKPAAAAQDALRKALDEIGRGLGQALGGKVPPSLAEAGKAMAGASGSLSRDAWGDAAEQQGEAVQLLRQGAEEAVRQLEAQGRGSARMGQVPRDPFGRPMRNGMGLGDDGTTRMPGASEVQRAREILDEIRKRTGDPQRPAEERDYLQRLLKQY